MKVQVLAAATCVVMMLGNDASAGNMCHHFVPSAGITIEVPCFEPTTPVSTPVAPPAAVTAKVGRVAAKPKPVKSAPVQPTAQPRAEPVVAAKPAPITESDESDEPTVQEEAPAFPTATAPPPALPPATAPPIAHSAATAPPTAQRKHPETVSQAVRPVAIPAKSTSKGRDAQRCGEILDRALTSKVAVEDMAILKTACRI
jgi:hypothetical protein